MSDVEHKEWLLEQKEHAEAEAKRRAAHHQPMKFDDDIETGKKKAEGGDEDEEEEISGQGKKSDTDTDVKFTEDTDDDEYYL